MRTFRRIAAAVLCLLVCVFLVSCGRKEAAYDGGDYYSPSEYGKDYWREESYVNQASDSAYMPAPESPYEYDAGKNAELYGLKMTYRASVDLETLDAAKAEAELMKAIAACGGYVSDQWSEGGYTSSYGDYVNRCLRVTVKVPADKLDQFLQGMEGYASVTSISRSAEDITAQYTDTEARLSSLQTQKARLEELMSEAGSLTELLEVEDRLSYVIYEIESYTAQMNRYKDLVAFSTVTVNLHEVTTATRTSVTFLERVRSAFASTWYNFTAFLGDAVIFLIDALPFLLVAAVAAFLIIRKVKKVRVARRASGSGNGAV